MMDNKATLKQNQGGFKDCLHAFLAGTDDFSLGQIFERLTIQSH